MIPTESLQDLQAQHHNVILVLQPAKRWPHQPGIRRQRKKGKEKERENQFSKNRYCYLVPALNIGNTVFSLQMLNLVHCHFTIRRAKN